MSLYECDRGVEIVNEDWVQAKLNGDGGDDGDDHDDDGDDDGDMDVSDE